MHSKNKHIYDYLTYYKNLRTPPEYAVLIKGSWGCGKTWFITNFLDEQTGNNYLYVSLHGLSSIEDIENEFFRLLHPILASKGMQVLGKLTKSVIKATISLDLDKDGKSNGNVSVSVPDVDLLKQNNIPEDKILVFDDIERCAIKLPNLLGYINQLVEHSGFKVILIADEEKIGKKKNGSKCPEYISIKEKLIGKTLDLKPEFKPALQFFVKQLQHEETKSIISENRPLIEQIYRNSKYKNLRILRHALLDFERVYVELKIKCKEKKSLVSHLLAYFLIYSFEFRSGNCKDTKLGSPIRDRFNESESKKNSSEQEQPNVFNKYLNTEVDLGNSLLTKSIWKTLFTSGLIPSEEMNEVLLNSVYFQSENRPDWLSLLQFKNLTDSEFEKLLNEIEKRWKNKEYNDWGVVMHLAGVLIHLSEINLYHESEIQIVEFAKQYIDELKVKGNLPPSNKETNTSFDKDVYCGQMFYSLKHDSFKKLQKYLFEKRDIVLQDSYKAEAVSLIELMENDTGKFMQSLVRSNHVDNKFYEIPILIEIKPELFVQTVINLLEVSPGQLKFLAYTFQGRYEHNYYNRNLIVELDWLEQVVSMLEIKKQERSGKLSEQMLDWLIDPYITDAINKLRSLQSIVFAESSDEVISKNEINTDLQSSRFNL
jgi:KAP family P-loop domain